MAAQARWAAAGQLQVSGGDAALVPSEPQAGSAEAQGDVDDCVHGRLLSRSGL